MTIKIDKTAPVIDASINAPDPVTGWYNIATGAPIYRYTASDSSSGLATGSAATGSYTFGETTGAARSLHGDRRGRQLHQRHRRHRQGRPHGADDQRLAGQERRGDGLVQHRHRGADLQLHRHR